MQGAPSVSYGEVGALQQAAQGLPTPQSQNQQAQRRARAATPRGRPQGTLFRESDYPAEAVTTPAPRTAPVYAAPTPKQAVITAFEQLIASIDNPSQELVSFYESLLLDQRLGR
jgi:hypothetical protein